MEGVARCTHDTAVKVNAPSHASSVWLFKADRLFNALWDASDSLFFKWIISVILYVPCVHLQTSRDSTLLILSMLVHLFIHTSEAAVPEIKHRWWAIWLRILFKLRVSGRSRCELQLWCTQEFSMQAKCPCELPTDCLLIVLKVDGGSDWETLSALLLDPSDKSHNQYKISLWIQSFYLVRGLCDGSHIAVQMSVFMCSV